MIDLLLAPNPGPMTLEGTNTYLVGDPARPRAVVDPGPLDEDHLTAIIGATPAGLSEIWLTHHHDDHLAAVPELAARTGALVRSWRTPEELGIEVERHARLVDHQELPIGAGRAIHIPGHTSDSTGFLLPGPDGMQLLTGDMVLGRGTTVIMHPDGDVGAYLRSLDRMSELVQTLQVRALLPGHGPRLDDPAAVLEQYRRHRHERLDQVRSALAAGARDAEQVVGIVYAEVDPSVRDAALLSVRAQLAYLRPDA